MRKLTKVAILLSEDAPFTFELVEVQSAFRKAGIETRLFRNNDQILFYRPDCVIVTSPQHAKLTPYPTYGLINKPRDEYLELPRFLRNILTYDGYFTFSPRLKQMLGDIMFGARKLGTSVLGLDFFPMATEYRAPNIKIDSPIILFEANFSKSKFKDAIYSLLEKIDNLFVITFSIAIEKKYPNKFIRIKNAEELSTHLSKASIAICLESGNEQEKTINPAVIKLIASSAVTITHQTSLLENYFKDNIYYIPAETKLEALPTLIDSYIHKIKNQPQIAVEKSKNAYQIFLDIFAFDNLLSKFLDFHNRTLIDKGFMPNPDSNVEKKLPSVSYIIRTGGKHRPFLERTLDCLLAQQYPDLRVIFVIHAKFSYINEIIDKYKSLKIKVVEKLKSQRSQAIRDGMAAVETELFGLFDDDDELFPNHVRSLVKTLQYHQNRDWRGEIGMVYSGSIHADDTYPVSERVEYRDHKLLKKDEKRAIEHFKFYSSLLMSQHAWFMPNGWLARSKLIDEELLVDPGLDTCEDLYFELQIAQKAHFAFSAEVTAVHNFHHLGNSTIDDSHKHLPDTQRIALRNLMRVFPPDALYDTHYNIIGKLSGHDPNPIAYQESFAGTKRVDYFDMHPFYPFRGTVAANKRVPFKEKIPILRMPILLLYKFAKLEKEQRQHYRKKFWQNVKYTGLRQTIRTTIVFLCSNNTYQRHNGQVNLVEPNNSSVIFKIGYLGDLYYKSRLVINYLGYKEFFKRCMRKIHSLGFRRRTQ